jgi:hypothetical protein
LLKDPRRNTQAQLHRLSEIVKQEADRKDPWDETIRRRPTSLSTKLIRLVKEVQTCPPDGTYVAFHLYVFLIARVFYLWDAFPPFGNIGSDKAAESSLLSLVHDSRQKSRDAADNTQHIFFNFALAKRTIWNAMTADCLICASRASLPSNQLASPFDVPHTPCRRANSLTLIERLQQEAYGEIRSGIMLTLVFKLPKELCLLVFEFALAVEELPIDPTVFERGNDTGTDGDTNFRLNWTAKAEYRCLESQSSN